MKLERDEGGEGGAAEGELASGQMDGRRFVDRLVLVQTKAQSKCRNL